MTTQPHNDLSAMGGKDYGKDYGSQPLPLPAKCHCPPKLVRHSNYEPCTTRPPQSPPAGDELVEILDEIYQDKNTLGDFPIDRETAKSLLNAYILADRKATLERLKESLPADRETFDIDFPERNQRKEDMNFGKAIGFNECLVEVTQLIEQESWLEIQQAHIDNTEQS